MASSTNNATKETKNRDEVISIPAISPAETSTSISDISSATTAAPGSPVSSTQSSLAPLREDTKRGKSRLKKCRDKTLESELCKTLSKYVSKLMSDDQSRRAVAIAIMILAVVGLYHILAAVF